MAETAFLLAIVFDTLMNNPTLREVLSPEASCHLRIKKSTEYVEMMYKEKRRDCKTSKNFDS